MNSTNPTARGRWLAMLEQVLPEPTLLPLRNVHLIGPFENSGYQGLETVYPPEQEIDLTAVYRGKAKEVSWRHTPGLEGVLEHPMDLGAWLPTEKWSVLYVYAEVEVEYHNEKGTYTAPTDYMVTQTIKADGNGVFTYAAPTAGWWGFAALNTSDETKKHDGVDKDIELGAVIWVHFLDMK